MISSPDYSLTIRKEMIDTCFFTQVAIENVTVASMNYTYYTFSIPSLSYIYIALTDIREFELI